MSPLLLVPLFFFQTCLGASTHLVVVFGYPQSQVQWLFTYTKVTADYCWNKLYSNSTYDFGHWKANTCYLTAYQFIAIVYRGTKADGRKVGFRVTGGSCATGTNPPTYNNKAVSSTYHTISWISKNSTWSIVPKQICTKSFWSLRGGTKRLCYTYSSSPVALTYTTAQASYKPAKQLISSPMNLPEAMYWFKWLLKVYGYTKGKVVTDAKRKDSCNTAAKIKTTACRYPNGFNFIDSANPMHLYYTWVASPQISTSRRCVGIYVNVNSDSKNGKFDYFPCETTCDNGYCGYLVTVISM